MALSKHIEKVRDGLREGRFTSEAAVSQGIVLPSLHALGWPVFDTSMGNLEIWGHHTSFQLNLAKVLPPVSRFSPGGERSKKRESVLGKLTRFFERFFDISSEVF